MKDCDLEYVDKYRDQKAYSYFDSGFVDTIFIYDPASRRNKIFLYSKVQSCLTVSDKKMLWILVQKEPLDIFTRWCSCMTGTSRSCNHAVGINLQSVKLNRKRLKTLLFKRKLDQGQTLQG